MGWDNLEVVSGGDNEEAIQHNNTDERQSLFKQLSQFIGKDITSMISLPVWVFEPISFLEVLCEPMQFDELLHKAASAPDPIHRITYLSAWAIAGYVCATRTKKPFNPYLGETYEFLAPGNKYKCFCEQVSHHPPISVAHITSDKFMLDLEMELKTKFTGNSSDVIVLGSNHFTIPEFNDHFSWGHLDTCAHNVIIGGMWVDHFGTLEVINHTTGDKAVYTVSRAGWLGSGRFQVNGEIFDSKGNLRMKVSGKWNDSLLATKIQDGNPQGEPILLWKRGTFPASKWNWPKFNDDLNWLDDKYEAILPPTDSRLRPDRRWLEKGDNDTAGKEKHRLEEEQRAIRRARETKGEEYHPKYFKSVNDDKWGHRWVYQGGYWEERENRIKEVESGKSDKQEENKQ